MLNYKPVLLCVVLEIWHAVMPSDVCTFVRAGNVGGEVVGLMRMVQAVLCRVDYYYWWGEWEDEELE